MSLKNDIEMVKEELNSEEKFFEKAVITEKFVKKYKNVMIGSFVAVVLLVGGNVAYDINKAGQISAANETLTQLQTNPSDSAALARLSNLSPALSDVWTYSQAITNKDVATLESLENSKTMIVSDLVAYELAQDSKDVAKLDSYATKQNSIYKDLAQVQSAVILLNEGEMDLAHSKLSTINDNSSLSKIAKALLHYGVK